VPGGKVVAVCEDDQAEPFQAFEVFGNGVEIFLGGAAFELGGDLFGGPVAGGSAEQVADGVELGFMENSDKTPYGASSGQRELCLLVETSQYDNRRYEYESTHPRL
jgi:hypothetical protein